MFLGVSNFEGRVMLCLILSVVFGMVYVVQRESCARENLKWWLYFWKFEGVGVLGFF